MFERLGGLEIEDHSFECQHQSGKREDHGCCAVAGYSTVNAVHMAPILHGLREEQYRNGSLTNS